MKVRLLVLTVALAGLIGCSSNGSSTPAGTPDAQQTQESKRPGSPGTPGGGPPPLPGGGAVGK